MYLVKFKWNIQSPKKYFENVKSVECLYKLYPIKIIIIIQCSRNEFDIDYFEKDIITQTTYVHNGNQHLIIIIWGQCDELV